MTEAIFTTREIIRRCYEHSDTADANGLYTIGNTLYIAARELERLVRPPQNELNKDHTPL